MSDSESRPLRSMSNDELILHTEKSIREIGYSAFHAEVDDEGTTLHFYTVRKAGAANTLGQTSEKDASRVIAALRALELAETLKRAAELTDGKTPNSLYPK